MAGVSLSVVEAMSSGRPVVTTEIGDLRNLIDDGHDGFIVPVGDVSCLVEKANALLNDHQLRVNIGKAARQKVIEHWGAESRGRDFLALVDSLLK